MSDGFARAQVQYENKMPDEPKCLYGFEIGDRVKIINELLFFPAVDGYSTKGEVIAFDDGHILVQCGMRILSCYAEDMRKV
jgi:hypothetical protein